jgi:hypothetical protein
MIANDVQDEKQDQEFFSIFGNKVSKSVMDKILSYQYANASSEEFTPKTQNNE